eukprot:scaffold166847_cov22-Tisochrysis_lutea.AAC.4
MACACGIGHPVLMACMRQDAAWMACLACMLCACVMMQPGWHGYCSYCAPSDATSNGLGSAAPAGVLCPHPASDLPCAQSRGTL